MTTLYLVRHGEVHNPEGIIYGRLPGYGLSENGRRQLAAAAELLAGEGAIVALYSSPMQRAQESAAIIAARLGLPVQTAEQLLEMPENRWCELVEGELRPMSPPSCLHAEIVGILVEILGPYARRHKLGKVLPGDPGFIVARDPDTVLGPDIGFISAEHVAAEPLGEGFREGAPDLAIEVLSPGQAPREGHEKALAWLDAGATLVWVVNPAARTVRVYRSRSDTETLPASGELDGGALLPGFRCPIADLFTNP